MGLLISFVSLLLYIAVIILIAFAIVWLIRGFMEWTIDANVYKWGKIVVGLLCILATLFWLSGVLGMGGGLPLFWRLGYR
jgi:multidrug resistance efflux pump